MKQKENRIKAKILLIEDDELTVKTIKSTLEREGYYVSVAKDGDEAIEMIGEEVDLILLDLVMPQRSGFEVLKIIRQEKRLKTPVVILSNLGKDEDMRQALELGANDYLVKSDFSIQTIIRKIETIMEQAGGR